MVKSGRERRVRRSAVVRLVRVATARESAVSETEEEEKEEGHDFNVGDCVNIRAEYNPEMKCPARFSALQVEVSALES
eukprot:scaffold45403_cov57-Attheya_sp.AAC.4